MVGDAKIRETQVKGKEELLRNEGDVPRARGRKGAPRGRKKDKFVGGDFDKSIRPGRGRGGQPRGGGRGNNPTN